jgi:hypothetical protein
VLRLGVATLADGLIGLNRDLHALQSPVSASPTDKPSSECDSEVSFIGAASS